MKEQIRLRNGKAVDINDPDLRHLQKLDDHDLLLVMHTQMIALRTELKGMKKSFAGKWVQHVVLFVIVTAGGVIVTAGANAIVHAVGGQ